jgi:hypothetical protein
MQYRRDAQRRRGGARCAGLSRLSGLGSFVGLVVASAASPLLAGVAHAQTASEIATAKQWFASGLAHEEKGEFSAALELFRRAVQVKKTPQIVYHVGFCESRTGALVEELVDLDAAAAIARAAHADDVVAAAQAELGEVKKRAPTLEVRVTSDASPSRFVVDGSAIALSMLRTPMPLDPGEHTVTIEFADGGSTTRKATLAERDVKTVDLAAAVTAHQAAAPAEGAASPPSPTPVVDSTSPSPVAAHRSSTVEWVLVGVGAALAVGGGSLIAVARAKESSLDTSCPSHAGCDPSLESTYNTATTLNSVGLGVGIAGLAAVGVGASILLFRPTVSSSTALAVSPRGVSFVTSF